MRPGQIEPNELEVAILERIATAERSLRDCMSHLHVLSREFTGVGSFTKFKYDADAADSPKRHIDLDCLIRVPGVKNGLGAVLFCVGDKPECLELYTFGGDRWDGVYDGYAFESTA